MSSYFADLRKELNLTQVQLAELCNLTRLSVIRNEQALYYSPISSLIGYFLREIPELTALMIESEYKAQQRNTRMLAGMKSEHLLVPGILNANITMTGPQFKRFRMRLGWQSQMSFCKDWCMHPAPYAKWESNLSVTVPAQLLEALTMGGASWRDVKDRLRGNGD
jgi:hypothetical protein